jgi:hypothetical protein
MSARNIPLKLALLLSGLVLSASTLAQSPSANLSGKAMPGDVAVVHNTNTGFSREVKVRDDGRYQLRNLPTGTFSVTIRHPDGSTEQPRTVTLHVGTTARVL